MEQYHALLRRILDEGTRKDDRTGTGTLSVFGHQMRFDLSQGFPVLTTKKLHLRSIFGELLWFLRGDTNVAWLHERKISIWDEWADADGDLGPIYGHQWRSWPTPNGETIDQIARVVESMSCQLYQRSGDVFLGVPFNIASYALLTHMVAQVTGLAVGDFVHTLGDAHLYVNHLDQARLQLTRTPKTLPTLVLNPDVTALDAFELDDIRLDGYEADPAIKAEVAV